MNQRIPLSIVALASLVFTYLFFCEYLSPARRVHIPYDLEGYHYPLVDYAFQSLKNGRFPVWDWTIYCGQSFVGNIQAAIFYPPTWLLFAVNLGRVHVSYQSLQWFQFGHIWLAFFLCFLWLRSRQLLPLASILGAGIFAFSGYALLQLQHLGLLAGYTWFPLGMWGIDQAAAAGRWQPLWKVTAASALCLLAGYPPTWFVFAVSMAAYALASRLTWRTAFRTLLAIGASLALTMIQLLPAWEAASLKAPELNYGSGIPLGPFFLSYLVPNFFNFGMDINIHANPGKEYLYLGAPCIVGMVCLLRSRAVRKILPFLAVGVLSIIFVNNPFGIVWGITRHSALLAQLCRDWYFLAGLTVAAAPLAAYGLDDFLRHGSGLVPGWLAVSGALLLFSWSAWELVKWLPGGPGFAVGCRAVFDPTITLLLVALGLYVVRGARGGLRRYSTAVLLLAIGIDYKVFGTSKRFNAALGSGQPFFAPDFFPAMDPLAFAKIRANTDYRILIDTSGPPVLYLRHYPGLRSPQGADPLLTSEYRRMLGDARFRNAREFDIDPDKGELLELLGVKYFITTEGSPMYPRYRASSTFHEIASSEAKYKVFEYQDPRLPYGWEAPDSGKVERIRSTPESREFIVDSSVGGRFTLHEQFSSGWQASLDGRLVPIQRWRGGFQSVVVPRGQHRLQFQFRSTGFRFGAWFSVASFFLFLFVVIHGSRNNAPPVK